jgi:DDE superfamily endonuclease
LTSDAVKLIAPDKQLARIGHPHILIPRLRGRLFFFDEAKVSWCPQTGRVYRVVGKEYKVNTPGENKTWYILGSLEYPSGDGLYEIYERQTNVQVQLHWQHLLDECPNEFVFVVRDNASQHVTPALDDFLLEHQDRFCLVPLPTYSPHLNLIEHLWHYMRDNITRSAFYITLENLCENLVDWLKKLSFERFQSLLGLSP